MRIVSGIDKVGFQPIKIEITFESAIEAALFREGVKELSMREARASSMFSMLAATINKHIIAGSY